MIEKCKNIKYLPKRKFPFTKKLLSTSKKLDLLLQDPNYLLKLKINLLNVTFIEEGSWNLYKYEIHILVLIYIISLLHNKTNYFIIHSLLFCVDKYGDIKIENNKLIFKIDKFKDTKPILLSLLLDILKLYDKNDFTKYVTYEI